MTAPRPDTRSSPTVVVIDDHEMISTSLVVTLRARGLQAHAVRMGPTEEIARAVRRFPAGLALLDLDLGKTPQDQPVDGSDLVRPLVEDGWRVILVTGTADRGRVAAAVAAGVLGYVPKSAPISDLLRTIQRAARNEPVMSAIEREHWLEVDRRACAERRARAELLDRLTAREREILDQLAQGRRVAAIAAASMVSPATVRAQVRAILAKLGVSSQLEAVAVHRAATG